MVFPNVVTEANSHFRKVDLQKINVFNFVSRLLSIKLFKKTDQNRGFQVDKTRQYRYIDTRFTEDFLASDHQFA